MRKSLLFVVFISVLYLVIGNTAFGQQPKLRTVPALDEIWAKLDAARLYRKDWRDTNTPKSYDQIISAYTTDSPDDAYTGTPQQLFLEAANEFRNELIVPEDVTPDADKLAQAAWGLQESLNEYMVGQLLLGNDDLVEGLRARFIDKQNDEVPDPLTLLTESEAKFQSGIDQVVEDLRLNPAIMRSSGTAIQEFPIFVQNSDITDDSSSPVENELYQFTSLVERKAMASNSKGKRMFFFGNVNDVDNFPYNNFPGQEDLDFNGDGDINEGGRADAANQLKKSAHSTYLHTALLTAIQSEEDFERNNGYQLKRQVKDAQVVFDDIQAGSNPLDLLGDFIPYQPVENFLNLANTRVIDAINTEEAVKNAERAYDTDQTTLSQTLQSQQENYLDRIQQLSGVDLDGVNLLESEGRNLFYFRALVKLYEGDGEMGIQKLVIDEAMLAAKRAAELVKQIPQKIQEEEERHNATTTMITAYGKAMSVLSMAESIASSVNVSEGTSSGNSSGSSIGGGMGFNDGSKPSFSFSSSIGSSTSKSNGISYNPNAEQLSFLRGQRDILSAIQQTDLGDISHAATIRQLQYEQALNVISFLAAKKAVKREEARLEEMHAQLERLIRNYISARTDMANHYYMNPAYRLDRDQLTEAAEASFETAMTDVYYAAKALEYLWSEKYNNPVPRLGGGLPEALSASYDPYVRAESVFTAKFAHQIAPNLNDFMDALQAWDLKMRQMRGPANQSGTVLLSMRKDILGFNTEDDAYDKLLFKNFIDENRTEGLNPNNDDLIFEFSMQIGDEQLFPALPNLKIKDIRINLVSDSSRSIRGGMNSNPAQVDLVMMDESNMRTFFADFPTDDDILTLSLESGRTLDKSPFIAVVESKIDNYSYPEATPNTQLADHSPACNRWVLRIKMNRGANQELLLDHMEDIEIQVTYQYGKPRDVGF